MSDLREALHLMLMARADRTALANLTGTAYDAAADAWAARDAAAAEKALAALSAEPAQEMTDEQISDCQVPGLAAGMPESILAFARNVIAADRASRLPEMGEGDWPELVAPFEVIDYDSGPRKLFTENQLRAAQVAAVEAYKALVREKT